MAANENFCGFLVRLPVISNEIKRSIQDVDHGFANQLFCVSSVISAQGYLG